MISLAGTPALLPALVEPHLLDTANALETLSYTISGAIGPVLAGLIIARFNAPVVLLIDALSYATFALALWRVRRLDQDRPAAATEERPTVAPLAAVRFVITQPVLLATSIMFMLFNAGGGILALWLPILATRFPGQGSALYGFLLSAAAVGETVGASIGGSVKLRMPLGLRICLAQSLAGGALAILLSHPTWWLAAVSLALFGGFSAPLTIWAQTLRMRIIPDAMRGRVFALLRTMMQATGPLSSAGAGLLFPVLGLTWLIAVSTLLIGLPGLMGLGSSALRHADAMPRDEDQFVFQSD
jgi:hypothetical protein